MWWDDRKRQRAAAVQDLAEFFSSLPNRGYRFIEIALIPRTLAEQCSALRPVTTPSFCLSAPSAKSAVTIPAFGINTPARKRAFRGAPASQRASSSSIMHGRSFFKNRDKCAARGRHLKRFNQMHLAVRLNDGFDRFHLGPNITRTARPRTHQRAFEFVRLELRMKRVLRQPVLEHLHERFLLLKGQPIGGIQTLPAHRLALSRRP